jgi:hypothetical protein
MRSAKACSALCSSDIARRLPDGFTLDEGAFFAYLLTQERGRLKQEFLPKELVS